MKNLRHWIAYDTFKLVVALILLLIFIALLLTQPKSSQAGVPAVKPTAVLEASQLQQPTQTAAAPTLTKAPLSTPTQLAVILPSATPTAVLPTVTLSPTQPPAATSTPTAAPPTPEPSLTPTTAAAAAQQSQSTGTSCPLALSSQLSVSKPAVVSTNLNLRKEAGMDKEILLVLLPPAKVDVIGGPICIPYSNGAYLWWNVKTGDGLTGWSAEASFRGVYYFLKPVP